MYANIHDLVKVPYMSNRHCLYENGGQYEGVGLASFSGDAMALWVFSFFVLFLIIPFINFEFITRCQIPQRKMKLIKSASFKFTQGGTSKDSYWIFIRSVSGGWAG